MARLSKHIEKLEDRLSRRFGKVYDRHKGKLKFYIPIALCALYFYGLLINSIRLGIDSTFGDTAVESIWVANPLLNLAAPFTPTGLVVTGISALLFCLITKKGYIFFSGYKFIRDARGFDILPDGTHGTSKFMTRKQMGRILEVASIDKVEGTLLGKLKDKPEDDSKYDEYIGLKAQWGLNGNILVCGAPGSGKSRGFVIPFAMQCAKRKESIYLTDPKGELYAKMAPYLRAMGYTVRVFNLLDMEHSDGWNALDSLDGDLIAVQTAANVIIQNTNGPEKADGFWNRCEISLLEALLYYVCLLTPEGSQELFPIEYRGLGDVYRLLSTCSIEEINERIRRLPPEHPAHGPHGNFLKAQESIWGNIAIGLGNRLAVFQSGLVDQITRHNDMDLLLPGKEPCAYFCVVSAQDSTFRFLSSLYFSTAITRLSHYAQKHGPNGRLPVTVNFLLDEYANIGYLDNMSEALASCRGFNINMQLVVQSLAQYKHRYPKDEWETQAANCDTALYIGCNDTTTAEYFSVRCGKATISVTNNQMPLMPLFSPIYSSTRPYSQTKSNTQRDLMLADEILSLDKAKCLVLIRGERPLLLYKVTPEEHPAFSLLTTERLEDYYPPWSAAPPVESIFTVEARQRSGDCFRPPVQERRHTSDNAGKPPRPASASQAVPQPQAAPVDKLGIPLVTPEQYDYIPEPPPEEEPAPQRRGRFQSYERGRESTPADIRKESRRP